MKKHFKELILKAVQNIWLWACSYSIVRDCIVNEITELHFFLNFLSCLFISSVPLYSCKLSSGSPILVNQAKCSCVKGYTKLLFSLILEEDYWINKTLSCMELEGSVMHTLISHEYLCISGVICFWVSFSPETIEH